MGRIMEEEKILDMGKIHSTIKDVFDLFEANGLNVAETIHVTTSIENTLKTTYPDVYKMLYDVRKKL